jgi:phage gp45-like
MISIIRGIITRFTNTANRSQKFDATGRSDESFTDREAFGSYGLAASLPPGADAVLLKSGQNVYLIASDDRRYRIAINEGEVALYTMFGDSIELKNDHSITINATGVGSRVIVNADSVELGGSTADPTDGCVTGKCSCAAYPVPHSIVSQKVKAKFL